MSFAKLFSKSNSSIHQLQGNVLDCMIEQRRASRVIINTGLRTPFVCFRDELGEEARLASGAKKNRALVDDNRDNFFPVRPVQPKSTQRIGADSRRLANEVPHAMRIAARLRDHSQKIDASWDLLQRKRKTVEFDTREARFGFLGFLTHHYEYEDPYRQRSCIIGIEEKRSTFNGEFICSPPKSMEKASRRKLVWTEFTKLLHSNAKNRIKGFILNSVNGGYAVAIAGYIAFLPRTLCLNKKVFMGQWRQFAIISMNPKIANIVVKEIKTNTTPGSGKNKAKYARSARFVRSRRPAFPKARLTRGAPSGPLT
jgi:hypothetical protein